MFLAAAILYTLMLYAACGLLFSIAFILRGLNQIDPAAHNAPFTFRILIIPGCAALWPILLRRWTSAKRVPHDA
jgi:hypothetical protein